MLPTDSDLYFLKQVIISCKYPSCDKEFDLDSLNELLSYQEKCQNQPIVFAVIHNKCKRCNVKYSNDKIHDCYFELKKKLENEILQKLQIYLKDEMNMFKIYTDEKIQKLTEENDNKHIKLSEFEGKINLLESKITDLSKFWLI
jgi:hypothetical protein